jgi:predicted TIM-barrel fold metal-dependent hydrolase
VHLHGTPTRFMDLAARDGMRVLTINVDYPDFPPLARQRAEALALVHANPGRAAVAAAFNATDLLAPDWPGRTLADLDTALAAGAVGVKLWKNVGMALKDADGHYVLADDPRLDAFYDHLERAGSVLLVHQAEPLNCWLPMEQMTVRSDREYFSEHPQYYMYRHPEMPSHEALLAARDRAIERHPHLAVDAVHLASLEWDVDRVAAFLDAHPAAYVDMAARLVHLEFQAAKDPAKVRDFLLRYQDRVLYGSDDAYGPADDDDKALAEVDHGWREDFRFLATADPMTTDEFAPPFHGLALPRAVVDRLYAGNARRLFPRAWRD